jgi:hypothetical protein
LEERSSFDELIYNSSVENILDTWKAWWAQEGCSIGESPPMPRFAPAALLARCSVVGVIDQSRLVAMERSRCSLLAGTAPKTESVAREQL